jgi:hypothetical protein
MSDDHASGLANSLARNLRALHRAGGTWLVMVFVGICCMAWAHFYSGRLSTPLFAVGGVVTVVCLGLCVWTQLTGPPAVRREIRYTEALEKLSFELTYTVDALQGLSVKNMKLVERVLGTPIHTAMTNLPGLESALQGLGVLNPRKIPELVVDASDRSKKAIHDITEALRKKDARKLEKQVKLLAQLRQTINRELAPPALFEALTQAVRDQNVAKARYLIDMLAPLERDAGAALIAAVEVGNLEMLKLLLAGGASPDARGSQDRTALILSVERATTAVTRALIAAKAAVDRTDKSGQTALMRAANIGNVEAVRLLIAANADPALKDHAGLTAIARARKANHLAVVAELEAADAKE